MLSSKLQMGQDSVLLRVVCHFGPQNVGFLLTVLVFSNNCGLT